jgi:hypothetical protein
MAERAGWSPLRGGAVARVPCCAAGAAAPADRIAAGRGRAVCSGDEEVEAGQRQAAGEVAICTGSGAGVAIGVVVQRAAAAVVDDEVVGVGGSGDPGAGAERAGGEGAGGGERAEDRVLELDGVVDDTEVEDRVAVGGRVRQGVEAEDVGAEAAAEASLPSPPARVSAPLPPSQGVVAGAAAEAVGVAVAGEAVGVR